MVGTDEWVYVRVPKTGSTSISHWLRAHHGAKTLDWEHSRDVPSGAYAFTVVREPVERALSMWDHVMLRFREHWPGIEGYVGGEAFSDFAKFLGEGRWRGYLEPWRPEGVLMNHLFMGQGEFLAGLELDLVLHWEELPECLTRLPWVGEVVGLGQRMKGARGEVVVTDEDKWWLTLWEGATCP